MNESMAQVVRALQSRGWRSLAQWAVAKGYKPVTARRVVYDWWHRRPTRPHGGIGRMIMADLLAEIGDAP